MKKVFLILAVFIFAAACGTGQKAEPEAPYNREGSKQERENVFRGKVFAAYSAEGHFYATYALADLVESTPDSDGKYLVRFSYGPNKGEYVRTRDVIFKTAHPDSAFLSKGMVVMRNFWNPKNDKNARYDRWNKAVVYSLDKQKDGIVVVEFPRDTNDFMATRETLYIHNLRVPTEPELGDPRKWLP